MKQPKPPAGFVLLLPLEMKSESSTGILILKLSRGANEGRRLSSFHCKGRENKNKWLGFRDPFVRFSFYSQMEAGGGGGGRSDTRLLFVCHTVGNTLHIGHTWDSMQK